MIMLNFIVKTRDFLDEVFEPVTRVLLHRRNIIQLLVVVFVIAGFIWFLEPAPQRFFGKIAWLLLLSILFLSPAADISQSKVLRSLMIFRREAGILMGFFVIWHSLLFFEKTGISADFVLDKKFWITGNNISALGWGAVAVILTLLLMITSNNFSMRLLKNNWKKLHRLAYVILILVVLHIAFFKKDFVQGAVIVLVYGIVKSLALSGWKLPVGEQRDNCD